MGVQEVKMKKFWKDENTNESWKKANLEEIKSRMQDGN